jgi:hypothetical protein
MSDFLWVFVFAFGISSVSHWVVARIERIVHKPRLAEYMVHCQRRTEADETMDFTVTLFKDETEEQWIAKTDKAFAMAEHRMKVQNDRMLAIMAEQQKLNEQREEA